MSVLEGLIHNLHGKSQLTEGEKEDLAFYDQGFGWETVRIVGFGGGAGGFAGEARWFASEEGDETGSIRCFGAWFEYPYRLWTFRSSALSPVGQAGFMSPLQRLKSTSMNSLCSRFPKSFFSLTEFVLESSKTEGPLDLLAAL